MRNRMKKPLNEQEHTYGGQWKDKAKIKLKDLIKTGGMEVVTWRKDGGYDVAYWYDKPTNIVPAELKGDGKSFGDVKNVYLGFHPELDDDKTY